MSGKFEHKIILVPLTKPKGLDLSSSSFALPEGDQKVKKALAAHQDWRLVAAQINEGTNLYLFFTRDA
jgi:hypothetical protein